MSKPKCPLCKFVFTHKRGMKYCTCKESAVDYNSGSEIDLQHAIYTGVIAEELIKKSKEKTMSDIKNTDLKAIEDIRKILDDFYPEVRVKILEYCLFVAIHDEQAQ